MAQSRFLKRFVTAIAVFGAVLAAGAAALAWWWAHPPDPIESLREHWAAFDRVERAPRPDLGDRVERWIVRNANGQAMSGIWRSAPSEVFRSGEPVWTVVLMGGLVTGEQSTFLVPEHLPVNVLAMDWPWDGPRDLEGAEFVRLMPAMKRALLSSPGCLAIGTDAVAIQPEVDATRIALIGVSLGVPAATGAVHLTDAPTVLVLVDGALHIDKILEADIREMEGLAWLAAPLSSLTMRLIDGVEPAHHLEAVKKYPTLLINSHGDDRLVPEGIEALHAALPDAERVWRDDLHVRPDQPETIATLVREIYGWLEKEPQLSGP